MSRRDRTPKHDTIRFDGGTTLYAMKKGSTIVIAPSLGYATEDNWEHEQEKFDEERREWIRKEAEFEAEIEGNESRIVDLEHRCQRYIDRELETKARLEQVEKESEERWSKYQEEVAKRKELERQAHLNHTMGPLYHNLLHRFRERFTALIPGYEQGRMINDDKNDVDYETAKKLVPQCRAFINELRALEAAHAEEES